jgi:hypothetical protein
MVITNIPSRSQTLTFIQAKTYRAVKECRSESGSVESALVLVPLLILFLITMQIGVAINLRNVERTFAQSEAAERAISGQLISTDQVIGVGPLKAFNSLGILVSRKVNNIPILLPIIGSMFNRGHSSDVTGIAVLETLS